jgi:hypothetical protein
LADCIVSNSGVIYCLNLQGVKVKNKNKPLATQAMNDLIELTILAKDEPAAAYCLQEHFKLSMPVLVIDVESDSAVGAGEPVVHFKLNETLMAHLSALRAAKRENGLSKNI